MSGGPCRILVVDDESELVGSLKEVLQAQGYQVLTAMDGVAAVNAVRSEKLDLILLDLMLPLLDGFRILKLLKTDERYRGIPIIVITARSNAEDWTLAMECGADGWLTKPVKMEELLERVRAAVVNKRVERILKHEG